MHVSRLVAACTLLAAIASAQNPAQTTSSTPYVPITGEERLKWFANSSFGLRSTGVGIFNSGWNTAFNSPEEWHGTWEGFGKRLANRTATVAISNSAEASFGAIWGEDPRYISSHRGTVKQRIGRALLQSVASYNRNGNLMPSYARYIGNIGNNFLSNTWRPASENDWQHALSRSGWGLSSRMLGNGVDEFWPEIKMLIRKMKR